MPAILTGTPGLLFGAAGIYTAFLYYGTLQEDVFNYQNSNGQKFTQAWFLQAVEALANVLVGGAGMWLAGPTKGLPLKLFGLSGATQVAAKACMSSSLAAGLSFPVATLAKSAKMAPVMAGGIILGGKKYTVRQYIQVAAIIGATVMVSMSSSKGSSKGSSFLGVVYICLSLLCDGLTGGVQDRLKEASKAKGVKVKPYDMMFWTNFFMFLVGLLVSTLLGETFTGLQFILDNPELINKVLLFGACSALGQSFIFFVVAEYGPLKNATVTTTRKIFSVLLSIFINNHPLNWIGWMGILMGSAGIIGELIPEKKKEAPAKVQAPGGVQLSHALDNRGKP